MQEAVRRFLVGGMHIHAGFGTPDSRVRVMTAIRRHLPIFIALSASSPFNAGGNTGFKSYRPIVIGALPRTGLPRPFRSQAEFDGLVEEYRRIGAIRDSSELRTDIRPSHAYPTIELRSCDICPRMDESIALAALYASLLRWLLRRDEAERPAPGTADRNHPWRTAGSRSVTARLPSSAMSSGGGRVDIADCTEALVEEVAEDARALGCEEELRRVVPILYDGPSADRQLERYSHCRLEGADHRDALRAVVDQLLEETRAGIRAAG